MLVDYSYMTFIAIFEFHRNIVLVIFFLPVTCNEEQIHVCLKQTNQFKDKILI